MLAIAPAAPRAVSRRSASASAVRSPSSARRPRDGRLVVRDRALRQRIRSTCRSTCCSASRRGCRATCATSRARCRRSTSAAIDAARRRVPRAAAAGRRRQDVPGHHRRSHRRRPVRARPDGRTVAGAGRRRRGHAAWTSTGYAGEAMAIGERTPLALIDAPASGRMAVGEAITNIAAAGIAIAARRQAVGELDGAAPGIPARTPRSTTRCAPSRSIAVSALGIAIPVGKDSMSMRTTWRDDGGDQVGDRAAVADRLGVRAGRRRARARSRRCCDAMRGETALLLIDLAGGRSAARRLGARAGARAARRRARPTSTTRTRWRAFFAFVQRLRDGTHAARLSRRRRRRPVRRRWCEMAFASRCGLEVALDGIDADAAARAVHRGARRGRPGARRRRQAQSLRRRRATPGCVATSSATPVAGDRVRIRTATAIAARRDARRPASRLVGDHACAAAPARQPGARGRGVRAPARSRPIPALPPHLTFDPADDIAAPFIATRRAAARSRSCASRASTARSRWRRRSTAPASTPSTCT